MMLCKQSPLPLYGDGRNMRIGILGGSFNPAHQGHYFIAQYALKKLQLDQVWLMVSPGNPLKAKDGMADFDRRLQSACLLSDGRRIIATDIEKRLKQHYSFKTIESLLMLFPRASFVWLMGADGLAQFHRWKNWKMIAEKISIVVFPRPGNVVPALRGRAASALRHKSVASQRALSLLKKNERKKWTFLLMRQNAISATSLRNAGLFDV